jgi:xanthine dehydrogenase accessory factor
LLEHIENKNGLGPLTGDVLSYQQNWDGTTPYALATIVHTVGATAAKPGDRAIVTKAGELIGFVGGGCVRHAILKAAATSISENKSRLICTKPKDQISKEDRQSDVEIYSSGCPSRGEMSIFIEPVIPKPSLVVFGETELARALVQLGGSIDLDVRLCTSDAIDATDKLQISPTDLNALPGLHDGFIVIATQGIGDKVALEAAFASQCPHILFVASKKKAAHWIKSLASDGYSKEQLARLIAPAGLWIKAKQPGEIAIAVLAQIIELRRGAESQKTPDSTGEK